MPREKKPFTAADLREIGQSLERLSGQLYAVADKLQDFRIKEAMMIDGGSMVDRSLTHLTRFIRRSDANCDELILAKKLRRKKSGNSG